jgi:uracil-DNA glycosylase
MTSFRDQLHPSWAHALQDLLPKLDEIEKELRGQDFLPHHENVMRALTSDVATCKVLIVGQDPYPNSEHAVGLAFSIPSHVVKLPATLRNIFKELDSDLGLGEPANGDLTHWHEQGVVLLNRTLTCRPAESNSHLNLGWRMITDRCAQILAEQGAVAILWGNSAGELSGYFPSDKLITSVHPSPLSAYRGFFGSKPFTRANEILVGNAATAIKWL